MYDDEAQESPTSTESATAWRAASANSGAGTMRPSLDETSACASGRLPIAPMLNWDFFKNPFLQVFLFIDLKPHINYWKEGIISSIFFGSPIMALSGRPSIKVLWVNIACGVICPGAVPQPFGNTAPWVCSLPAWFLFSLTVIALIHWGVANRQNAHKVQLMIDFCFSSFICPLSTEHSPYPFVSNY